MKKIITIMLFFLALLCGTAYAESAKSKLDEMYYEAEVLMTTGDYSGAADIFEALGTYSDASKMAMYCKAIDAAESYGLYSVAVKAFKDLGEFKDSKQMAIYYEARGFQASGEAVEITEATADSDLRQAKDDFIHSYQKYSDLALFKDCLSRAGVCQAKADEIAAELQRRSDAAEAELRSRLDAEREESYQRALLLEQNGDYQESLNLFYTIQDYKDSREHIVFCKYKSVFQLEMEGLYWKAAQEYDSFGNYMDSQERKNICLSKMKDLHFRVVSSELREESKHGTSITTHTYEYDAYGKLVKSSGKTENASEICTYEYNKDGVLVSGTATITTKTPNGEMETQTVKYKYNEHGDILQSDNGSIIMYHEYKYSDSGDMLMHHYGVGENYMYGWTFTFDYVREPLAGLIVESHKINSDQQISETIKYEYDGYGNIQTKTTISPDKTTIETFEYESE